MIPNVQQIKNRKDADPTVVCLFAVCLLVLAISIYNMILIDFVQKRLGQQDGVNAARFGSMQLDIEMINLQNRIVDLDRKVDKLSDDLVFIGTNVELLLRYSK